MSEEMVQPYADDDPMPTPPAQDPDEAYDQSRVDELNAELIAITRLAALKHRIESLHEDICSDLIGKPRA